MSSVTKLGKIITYNDDLTFAQLENALQKKGLYSKYLNERVLGKYAQKLYTFVKPLAFFGLIAATATLVSGQLTAGYISVPVGCVTGISGFFGVVATPLAIYLGSQRYQRMKGPIERDEYNTIADSVFPQSPP